MRQTTAKTVEDVLDWVENNQHHIGSWIDTPGFFILKGHGAKIRIPEDIQEKTRNLVEPSKDRFDSRMYRATKSGKARLRRAKRSAQ